MINLLALWALQEMNRVRWWNDCQFLSWRIVWKTSASDLELRETWGRLVRVSFVEDKSLSYLIRRWWYGQVLWNISESKADGFVKMAEGRESIVIPKHDTAVCFITVNRGKWLWQLAKFFVVYFYWLFWRLTLYKTWPNAMCAHTTNQ